MGSEYGYITIAALEVYTGINYETTKATYIDAFVDAQISVAERIVRSIAIDPPDTATDEIYAATMILSERFMRNVMVTDGYAAEQPQSIKDFLDNLINLILAKQKGMIDSIPHGRGGYY